MENLYEKARRAVIEAFLYKDWTSMDDAFVSLTTSEELDFNLIPESVRVPSPYADKEAVLKQTARQTVFIVSLSPVFDLSRVPLEFVTFYDVAEGLMAAYVFGELDVRYMPIARTKGIHKSLRRLRKFLEMLGFFRNNTLTGIGQALAKALIYGAAKRTAIYIIGFYLSAAVANALLSELSFIEVNGRYIMMEAIARYKRIRQVVDDWIKIAPKLYLRDTPIFYEWGDAVKDAVIAKNIAKNVEDIDFRFTL